MAVAETLDPLRAFVAAVNRHEAVALATVVSRRDSGGPEPTAKMAVWGDGRTLGSLGAAFDAMVVPDARDALAQGTSQSFIYPKTGGPRTRRAEQQAAFEVYVEVVKPPTLLVVGAGHVGGFVAKLGKLVGMQVAVIDDRPEFANRERFPEADRVICDDFIPALQGFPIDASTFLVVVTRGHKQDETSVRAVIGSKAGYIGMIGSRRRAGAVLKLLRESGVPRAALERVRTPIGLDIGAETPEEIAVAIIAEIIMTRLGGTGRPLSQVEKLAFLDA